MIGFIFWSPFVLFILSITSCLDHLSSQCELKNFAQDTACPHFMNHYQRTNSVPLSRMDYAGWFVSLNADFGVIKLLLLLVNHCSFLNLLFYVGGQR